MNDIHDLLGAYCTDALGPEERDAFEEHLRTCSTCRDEAVDFREVLAVLAEAHAVRPPASLEDAIVAGVVPGGRPRDDGHAVDGPGTSATPGTAATVTALPTRRRAARWTATAAAGAILFAGGFGLGRHQEPSEPAAAPAGDMAVVVAVASAADADVVPVDMMGTAARLVMSEEMGKAAFLASDVPMPAKGLGYQVWTVSDGRMVPAGWFTPTDDGHVAAVFDCDAGVDSFVITLEPPGGSGHPTGEMLAEVPA